MTEQLAMVLPERAFDGASYQPSRDYDRLSGQLERVYVAMQGGAWHTLDELATRCGGSVASISSRVRDLRKKKYGSRQVEREFVSKGLWRYRLLA